MNLSFIVKLGTFSCEQGYAHPYAALDSLYSPLVQLAEQMYGQISSYFSPTSQLLLVYAVRLQTYHRINHDHAPLCEQKTDNSGV